MREDRHDNHRMPLPMPRVGDRVSLTVRNGTMQSPAPGHTIKNGVVTEVNVPHRHGCTTRAKWDDGTFTWANPTILRITSPAKQNGDQR